MEQEDPVKLNWKSTEDGFGHESVIWNQQLKKSKEIGSNSELYAGGTEVLVEDKLFATLDPTTRRLELPNGQSVLVTDTVGFIRKLPHHLVAAFRATLEEIRHADLLFHVVDASHPYKEDQIQAVLEVLKELGAEDKEVFTIWNKMDRLNEDQSIPERLIREYQPSVMVSADKQTGFENLLKSLVGHFEQRWQTIKVMIPHSRADLVAQLHKKGKVRQVKYLSKGTKIEAQVLPELAGKYREYQISK